MPSILPEEKVVNSSSSEIHNIPFKANRNFIIACDATFTEKEGKSAYGIVTYFDHSLVLTDAIFGYRCSSAKEVETHAIL